MRAPRRNQRGFTLLEVLVATVIMGIAVVALISNLSTSMRTASRLTDYDRASMLARQKMDELLTDKKLPRGQMLQGSWPVTMSQGLDAGWRAKVTPMEVAPGAIPGWWVLDRIELQVWWRQGEAERNFTLESYRRGILTRADFEAGVVPMPTAPK